MTSSTSLGNWRRGGKAGSYIARFKKVLRSWFSFNGLDVKLKVNIAKEYDTPTIADERFSKQSCLY